MSTYFGGGLTIATLAHLLQLLMAQYSKDFAGPYTLNIRGLEDCPNHESLPTSFIGNKIRKFNRTTYLFSTNFSNSVSISDDVHFAFAFSTFGNGGWGNMQLEQNLGPACSAMWRFIPGSMKKFMDALGQKDCPIKPGYYVLKDYVVDTNINWPLLPYDRYRFELRYYLHGKLIGCKRFYIDCVPRKQRQPRNTALSKNH